MAVCRILVLSVYFLYFQLTECQTCSKIKDLLNDNSVSISGPDNDICILSKPSCCNKATENKLLSKTKEVLKNRVFLVLNQLYQKIDTDKNAKNTLLTKVITNSNLSQAKRMAINDKFYSYITGVNTLTTADLLEIKTASSVGALSISLGVAVPDKCQDLLYFNMEPLKNAELKYLGSILVMLRGYDILATLITKSQAQDLTEECYVGAVRGGLKEGVPVNSELKFGGCNLCYDYTDFSQPCAKLCRNILSGCLKGHIEIREYLQYLALQQIKLNELVKKFARERDTAVETLKAEVKTKLQVDADFYKECSGLKSGQEKSITATYDFDLGYTVDSARDSFDSDWLCKYVFSGVSEVNCWNKSEVDEYRLNVYEYTQEGQRQNPEVPGKGLKIDISDQISQYDEYKVKVEELSAGRDALKPNSATSSNVSLHLLTLISFFLLTW